jgi:hypothetical protein
MQRPVIQIRRVAGLDKTVHPKLLLLIGNKMLDSSNHASALNTLDSKRSSKGLEYRV